MEIIYPYLPEGKKILYVPMDNQYIQMAKKYAQENSLDTAMPNSSVLVKDGTVIGQAANGSDYHEKFPCQRVILKIPTGQGYDLCEGCHPRNHSEQKAIKNAHSQRNDPTGSDIYLWGHWWCCEPCWQEMIAAGIKNVYLVQGSEILFDKKNPQNIVGRQFDTFS